MEDEKVADLWFLYTFSCLKYEWRALDELLLPPKMVFTFFVMSRDLFVKLGKLKF